MKFSLLKVDNPQKLKSLSRNKINFFKKEEEITLFHFNMFDNDLYHAVFSINDEYQVSTKKLGNQHNFVYASLVNFFFLLNKEFAFLEFVNNEYQDEIINEIERKTKISVKQQPLDNVSFLKLVGKLNGDIKKIHYSNDDGELFDLDYTSYEKFTQIADVNTIDDCTISVEDQFITISNNGLISVDNSDEKFLVGFTKRILYAIS